MIFSIIMRLLGIPPSAPKYWWALEPFWDSIELGGTAKQFRGSFGKTPEHVQHLFAAHWAAREVMNGSLVQFFFNSSSMLAPEAVSALRAIGFQQSAQALDDAIRALGPSYPRNRPRRLQIIEPLYNNNLSSAQKALTNHLYAKSEDFLDGLGKRCKNFEPVMTAYAERFKNGV
jgi:hypothetical protein